MPLPPLRLHPTLLPPLPPATMLLRRRLLQATRPLPLRQLTVLLQPLRLPPTLPRPRPCPVRALRLQLPLRGALPLRHPPRMVLQASPLFKKLFKSFACLTHDGLDASLQSNVLSLAQRIELISVADFVYTCLSSCRRVCGRLFRSSIVWCIHCRLDGRLLSL